MQGVLLVEEVPRRVGRGLGGSYSDEYLYPRMSLEDAPNYDDVTEVHAIDYQDQTEKEIKRDVERLQGDWWTEKEGNVVFTVRGLYADEPWEIKVRREWTVLDLKLALHLSAGIDANIGYMRLIHNGRLMDDKVDLGEYHDYDPDEVIEYVDLEYDRHKVRYKLPVIREGLPPLHLEMNVLPSDTIAILKGKIEELTERFDNKIAVERQHIVVNLLPIDDDDDYVMSAIEGLGPGRAVYLRVDAQEVGIKRERGEGKFVVVS